MHRLRTRKVIARRESRRNILLTSEQLEQRIVFNNYWVTNLADDGVGSLRAAIVAANNHVGSDSISFKSNLSGVIALTRELQITGDTEIEGNSAKKITVSGQDLTRVFKIESGAKVAISDLTITKGKTTEAAGGGGILNLGNLTLQDSVVTGNTAVRTPATTTTPAFGGSGGGIRNLGNLRLDDSEVSNNKAFLGGGIANQATLRIEESKVTGNDALSSGGGILNSSNRATPTIIADTTIEESWIADNTCTGDGAGIRSETNTKLSIDESKISGNIASGFGTGGIASGGDLTITESLITRNQSAAAGIYLMAFSTGKVLISRSEISFNTPSPTSRAGVGGLWSRSTTETVIEDSVIRNNEGSVGGFYAPQSNPSLKIIRSQINGNKGSVGGLELGSGTQLIESTVSGNIGKVAGGIQSFGTNIDRSTISNNTATPTGYLGAAGILGNTRLVNSTVSGNILDAKNLDLSPPLYPFPFYTPRVAGAILASPSYSPDGNSSLKNTTIAFNSVVNAPAKNLAQSTGGVLGFSYTYEPYGTINADVDTRNTIIAKNSVNGLPDDVAGTFVSNGRNLLGVLTADASGFLASDLKGTATVPLDPRLEPLDYNGGFTKTHMLRRNSPARDAGDGTGATATDQRGYFRVAGSAIDIGAVEYGSSPATPQVEHHDWIFDGDRWSDDDDDNRGSSNQSNQNSRVQSSDDAMSGEKISKLNDLTTEHNNSGRGSGASSRHSLRDKLLEDLLHQL